MDRASPASSHGPGVAVARCRHAADGPDGFHMEVVLTVSLDGQPDFRPALVRDDPRRLV
jgi:hypothetical protein